MKNTVTPSRIVTVYRKGAMTMSFWKKQKETEKVPQSVEQEMPQSAQEHSAQGETKPAYSVDAYLQSLITQAELSHNEPPAEVRKPLRKREHQICIRLSDDEKKKFRAKLKASGKNQQTFVLDAVLRGGEDRRLEESAQEIEDICAEVDDQKKLSRIAYNCQKAANRRIYNQPYLQKAEYFRNLWYQKLQEEKAIKAKLKQLSRE